MYDLAALGRRLWAARKEHERREHRDVTFDEFADLVSKTRGQPIAAPQVSDYEKAKHTPKLDTLLAWAQVCDVDPGWLAFGDDARGRRIELPTPVHAPAIGQRISGRVAKRKNAG